MTDTNDINAAFPDNLDVEISPVEADFDFEDDFSTTTAQPGDLDVVSDECKYVKQLFSVSDLYVLQPALVRSAYNSRKELGLFYLFISKHFIGSTIRKWTN